MKESPGAITRSLRAHVAGETASLDELWEFVYPELRRRARFVMGRERSGHTLQPTALVNEAFMRLFDGAPVNWNDSQHFFAVAAAAMRRVLTDHARRAAAAKRQAPEGSWQVEAASMAGLSPEELLDLNTALEELVKISPRAAAVVDLKHFAGLTDEEAAAALGTKPRTVSREWAWARASLRMAIGGEGERQFALHSIDHGLGLDRENQADL